MRLRPLTMVIGLVAVLLAVGGSAYAAESSSATATGVIHGCVDQHAIKGGVQGLGVLKAGQASCPKHTAALNWNQVGPRGPAGPQGRTGAQGPAGPQGPQGPAGSVTGITSSGDNTITLSATESVSIRVGASTVTITPTSISIESPGVIGMEAPVINLNACTVTTTLKCP